MKFDLRRYVSYLLDFNATGAFYFVAFFIQLIIIAPLLYKILIINKNINNKIILVTIWIIETLMIILIAIISIKYTSIGNIKSGGKYLFGGTYLIVYWLGLSFANFIVIKKGCTNVNILISSLLCVCWSLFIFYNKFKLDRLFPLGSSKNPPGVTLIIYSLLIINASYFLFSRCLKSKYKIIQTLTLIWGYAGRYTFYIFLYHSLVRNLLKRTKVDNLFIKIMYIPLMIIIPIIIKKIVDEIKRTINNGIIKLKKSGE